MTAIPAATCDRCTCPRILREWIEMRDLALEMGNTELARAYARLIAKKQKENRNVK